jgi:hypothetical protein
VTDVTTISDDELLKDRADSIADAAVCDRALALGILTYSGGRTRERRDKNLGFVRVIDAELARRRTATIRSDRAGTAPSENQAPQTGR